MKTPPSVHSNLQPLPEHRAITHRLPLCLLWLNHSGTTPDCYKTTTRTSTHIRLVDYRPSLFLCITGSFPPFLAKCCFILEVHYCCKRYCDQSQHQIMTERTLDWCNHINSFNKLLSLYSLTVTKPQHCCSHQDVTPFVELLSCFSVIG